MLNKGKGPAVYSLRVQSDRQRYRMYMKGTLERQENLFIKQAEVVEILCEDGHVSGVVTHTGATFDVKAVIVASGTFLGGRIIIGDVSYEGGPDGMFPAKRLTGCLKDMGVKLMRFKTGTPARINSRSVDYSKFEQQKGDDDITPFSFETKIPAKTKSPAGFRIQMKILIM